MTQTIELYVSPTGETRIETRGFTGSSCQAASRFLEAALGTCLAETLTAAYFQSAATVPEQQELRP